MNDIAKTIGTATSDELKDIQKMVNARWDAIERQASAQFYVGQKVWFRSSKGYGRIEGVVTKVNPKTIKVRQDRDGQGPMNWRVSPGLLNAA